MPRTTPRLGHDAVVTTDVEFRCSIYPGVLFGRLRLRDGSVRIVADNLVEFACRSCRRARDGNGPPVTRVLHRFNLLGELVETEIVRSEV